MQSRFAYLPHRAVLSLEGPDTLALLERLVTCNTTEWAMGEARPGALLTPQGKIIADFLAIRTATGVLLDVHAEAMDDLAKRLKLFRLRAKVEIAPLEGVFIVAGVEPAEHGVRPVSGTELVYIDPRYNGGRLRAIASETEWRRFHGHEAEWSVPPDQYELDRIFACVPEWGFDYRAAEVFPADVNLDRLGGVDYAKGCFVGQEVVSRMYRRGKIRKRTLRARSTGFEVGASIEANGPIGEITSAIDGLALARVRLDRLARVIGSGEPIVSNGTVLALEAGTHGWLGEEMEAFRADD